MDDGPPQELIHQYESAQYESAGRVAWRLPDVTDIFSQYPQLSREAYHARTIVDVLASFDISTTVTQVEYEPTITRYTLEIEPGQNICDVYSLADELALALAATSVHVSIPTPGHSVIWVEVANPTVSDVPMRGVIDGILNDFSPLMIALGKDSTGHSVLGDLRTLPHLLLAGTTGAGKSVCINCIMASLLITATPDEIELLLIDHQRIELSIYNGIPHLKQAVISEASIAVDALGMIAREMDQRYERFASVGVRNIDEYNAKFSTFKLPHIVIVVDEIADMLMFLPAKTERLVAIIAESGRAIGVHLVIAMRPPLTDPIARRIMAHFPSRAAFKVVTRNESRAILGTDGAEGLLGSGEMLYRPIDAPEPIHLQGALVTNLEVERLVEHWKRQANPEERKAMEIEPIREDDERGSGAERKVDDLWYDAAKFLLDSKVAKGEAGVGSTAALQARFSIGHPRAVRLMKQLEEFGIVGPNEGTKPRTVLIESSADLERLADRYGRPAQTDLFTG